MATTPTNSKLGKFRNKHCMKHIMMVYQIWNIFTCVSALEIIGLKYKFKIGEFYGPLLWEYISRSMTLSTTVVASKLKDGFNVNTTSTFDNNVVKYNTWFEDKQTEIIKDDRNDQYNEYLRCIFRSYVGSRNEDFVDAIKEEKRKWTQENFSQHIAIGT